ncbi:MAG: ABC transporter substrate-binding protein [Xanthobacteraceae bacterium]|nr:ABC transporter substrate-binding protein [Xanthobacteraceae bacterium]
MRRRDFLAGVGGAAVGPLSAQAQGNARTQRIAILIGVPANDQDGQRWLRRLIDALRNLGWRNGTNVNIDLRHASTIDQMRAAAQELIDLKPDVIAVATTLASLEVLRKTTTIPVVFSIANDPVALGLVKDLSRPGGNATGFYNIEPALGQKWIEVLKEIAPRVTRVQVFINSMAGAQLKFSWPKIQAAGASLGITPESVEVRSIEEIGKKLESIGHDPQVGLVLALDDSFNVSRAPLITSFVLRHRLAAIYPLRDFVYAGGLISYAVDLGDLQRRLAGYVDRILKGERPGDLSVQGPTKFDLMINLKAAKDIGLTVPQTLRARANEVIELGR